VAQDTTNFNCKTQFFAHRKKLIQNPATNARKYLILFRGLEEILHKENPKKRNRNLWGIILAGGDGKRLKKFVENLYGYYRPKQYCKIADDKSLIKLTRDRVLKIIPSERIITIVNRSHLKFAAEEIGDQPSQTIVIQPRNRDTCAGILLPLLKINNEDPSSIVAILPADHFIYPENRFMDYVKEAGAFANEYADKIVMLGVEPGYPESGYGWIEPGDQINDKDDMKIYRVSKFWEKPEPKTAELLYANGCLLNTFVMVGSCSAFINYINLYAPKVYNAFNKLQSGTKTQLKLFALEEIYNSIPSINFSHSVLEKIPQHLVVLEIKNVYWSDWGEEQRILRDTEKFGLKRIIPLNKKNKDGIVLNIC